MASASGRPFAWRKLLPELSVSNFERSVRFYTEVLGFEVLFSRDRFVYLELEEIQFMLQAANNDTWQTAEFEHPFGRGINFQLELTDINPIYEHLGRAAYPLFRDKRDAWYETGDVFRASGSFWSKTRTATSSGSVSLSARRQNLNP